MYNYEAGSPELIAIHEIMHNTKTVQNVLGDSNGNNKDKGDSYKNS